jgi:hypothetical protein
MFVKDFYEEKGVVAKKKKGSNLTLWGFGIVAILGLVAAFLFMTWVPLVITLVTGIGFCMMFREHYVEYDYCVANDEIEINKIMNRKRRKTAISFNTNNIRFIAPENSIRVSNHLEQYPDIRVTDYTSKEPTDPVYAFVLDLRGINTIIYLEPTENMMKHFKNIIPDKVLKE